MTKSEFRPDIQGIRAVAVMTVLLFHVFPAYIPGGYVGVDVFFVISGFLITGLLVREARQDRGINFRRFYLRRIRRLLPASIAVLLLVAGLTILLPPSQWLATANEIVASAAYVENWYLANQAVDYLNADAAPSPLQHFWSLAIEEQFYFIWPAVIGFAVVLWRVVKIPLTASLIVLFAAMFGVSLWFSMDLTPADPAAYFYSHTRFWELAAGGLAALLYPRNVPLWLRHIAGVLGLGLIVAAAFVLTRSSPFPGYLALAPVIGCLLLILSGQREPDTSKDAVASLILNRPTASWLGDVSYSLYLWHWPIVIFCQSQLGGEPFSIMEGIGVIAISLLAAHVSKIWIEDRFRHPPEKPKSLSLAIAWPVAASLIVSVAAAGAIYGYVYMQPGGQIAEAQPGETPLPATADILPAASPVAQPAAVTAKTSTEPPATSPAASSEPSAPPTPMQAKAVELDYPGAQVISEGVSARAGLVPIPNVALRRKDNPKVYGTCHRPQARSDLKACVYGKADSSYHVVLVGDSHAASWAPTLERIAEQKGWRLSVYTKSDCGLIQIPVLLYRKDIVYKECEAHSANLMAELESNPPDLVVFTQFSERVAVGEGDNATRISQATVEVWRRLLAKGIRVVAILDTPFLRGMAGDCLDRENTCKISPARSVPKVDPIKLAGATEPRVPVLDFTRFFCGADNCPTVTGNVFVWRDNHHFTATYATTLAPEMARQLDQALKK